MKKVVVNGANGKMGKRVVDLILNKENTELVGVCDKKGIDKKIKSTNLKIKNNLSQILDKKEIDVVIDFTTPASVMDNIRIVLNNNINMIVGTTGITKDNLDEIKNIVDNTKIIIAPNFALGAVLMMKFSKKAAKYMDDVEIIELHHDQKIDSPSGTSIRTAELISENLEKSKNTKQNYIESLTGARGAQKEDINIHSVRLKGLVAHQEVIFGTEGQTLKIKHDSYDRSSFMPGVSMAIDKINEIKGLVYGLENILD
ncbi:MAG: 4-hydroxy-tetrahydrodipicolinate reductase [Bacillota bacterium]